MSIPIWLVVALLAAVSIPAFRYGQRRQAQADIESDPNSQLKMLSMAAEAAKIGYFVVDMETLQAEISENLWQIWGFKTAKGTRTFLPEWLPYLDPTDLPRVSQQLESLRNQTACADEFEFRVNPEQGEPRWIRVVAQCSYDEHKRWVMRGAHTDITARKQDELALIDANRVSEEAKTRADEMVKELQEQKNRQAQMFAVIGHELRTPVASLKMMLDEQQIRNLQPYGREIIETTDHLLHVLEDLRSVVKPEQIPDAELVVDSLFQVTQRAINSLRHLSRDSQTRIKLEGSPEAQLKCKFRAQIIRQLVVNLVKNALIHSGGTEIRVAITTRPDNQPAIGYQLVIEDNGKGISAEHQSQLFTPFYRADSCVDGTGLGLSICRDLAKQIDGDIHYESSPLGGARFVVDFTLDHCQQPDTNVDQPHETSITTQESLAGTEVLIAEDNSTIRLLTEKILSKLGARVTAATDGEQAYQLYQQSPQQFDLILTDIFMPRMDGYRLTRKLREAGYNGLVIGVTAATVGEEVTELLQCGADDALAKPISAAKLIAALAKLKEDQPSSGSIT